MDIPYQTITFQHIWEFLGGHVLSSCCADRFIALRFLFLERSLGNVIFQWLWMPQVGLFSQLCPKDMEVCKPHISDGWDLDSSRGEDFGGKMVVKSFEMSFSFSGFTPDNPCIRYF